MSTNSYRLPDLVDMKAMQKLADANYAIAGLPISILDAFDGTVLVAAGWQDICNEFHWADPRSNTECILSNEKIRKPLATTEFREFKCGNGLWHVSIPIVVSGHHLANMFLSQFLYEDEVIDRDFFIGRARQFDYNLERYLEALERVPLLSRSKVDKIIAYDKVMADFISNLADHALRKREAEDNLRVTQSHLIKSNIELKAEIAHRNEAEKELGKVNLALRIIGRSNAALVHASAEHSFLNEICRIITEEGKYLMAWIGYPQHDTEKTVKPYAHAGREQGYLSAIKVTWEDDEWGRGPTGTAIRTGAVCVQNNRLENPFMNPWRIEAAKRDFASAIGLPLVHDGKCFGSLTIYASQTDVFIEKECLLLRELADNVAFGIMSLRMREEKRQAEEEIKNSQVRLHNLAAHLQSIREEERTSVAREIHDELGQMLTAMKLNIARASRELQNCNSTVAEALKADIALVNTIIQSVKRICTELRPSILDHLGLGPAIEWQAQAFQSRSGVACLVVLKPEDIQVSPDMAIALFRILQESLTNVLRHANATKVKVSLTKTGDIISLKICDNGIGITKEALVKPNSFGLLGMRERVYPWGGKVDIKGTPQKGTTVSVTVPLQQSFNSAS